MSMSKKDFVELANNLGMALRHEGITTADDFEAHAPFITKRFLSAIETACRSANSAFSEAVFREHMFDVASGARDITGRKVKR